MMPMNLNDIAILKIKVIISGISKSEAIKLFQNNELTEEENLLKIDIKSNYGGCKLLKIIILIKKWKIIN